MKKLFSVAAILSLTGCASISHYYSPSIDVDDYETPQSLVSEELPEPFTFELNEVFNVKYSGHIKRHNHLTDSLYQLCSRNGGAYRRDSQHYATAVPDNLPNRTGIYSCYIGAGYYDRIWSVEVFNDGPRPIDGDGYESSLHIEVLDNDQYSERLAYHKKAEMSIHPEAFFMADLFDQAAKKTKEEGDLVCSFSNEYGEVLSVIGSELDLDVYGQLVSDIPGDAVAHPRLIKLAIENRRTKRVKADDWAVCFVDPEEILNTEKK